MDLHLLDCSQYIWAGSYSKARITRGVRESNGEYCENSAPIGGVLFLIKHAAELSRNGDVVMPVFDSTPELKREMYYKTFGEEYGYKGTRKQTSDMFIKEQKDYAYQILSSIGFPTQIAEGYESDDLLYTLTKLYKNDFDTVHVHTSDSDLYFLVGANVIIDTVGPNVGKYITPANYSTTVEKDGWCVYNGHHLRKLCKGDTSDNIPGIGMMWTELLDSVIPASELPKLGDLDLCRHYIKEALIKNPTAPNASRVLQTFNILVPLEVPEHFINPNEQVINKQKLAYYLSGWKEELDQWGYEDMLSDYIDRCWDGR